MVADLRETVTAAKEDGFDMHGPVDPDLDDYCPIPMDVDEIVQKAKDGQHCYVREALGLNSSSSSGGDASVHPARDVPPGEPPSSSGSDKLQAVGEKLGALSPNEGPVPGTIVIDDDGQEVAPFRENAVGFTRLIPYSQHHWSNGHLLSKTNKHSWWPIATKYPDSADRDIAADEQMVSSVVKGLGFDLKQTPTTVTITNLPTVGQWWSIGKNEDMMYSRLHEAGATGLFTELSSLQIAYHGGMLADLKAIYDNSPQTGENFTGGKVGVYCEGEHRKGSCIQYMTHCHVESAHPLLQWAVLYELVVDRSAGSSIHSQWVQPPESVVITNTFIHVFNILKGYDSGFQGFYRVNLDSMKALAGNAVTASI